jgi:hypothetical protein
LGEEGESPFRVFSLPKKLLSLFRNEENVYLHKEQCVKNRRDEEQMKARKRSG